MPEAVQGRGFGVWITSRWYRPVHLTSVGYVARDGARIEADVRGGVDLNPGDRVAAVCKPDALMAFVSQHGGMDRVYAEIRGWNREFSAALPPEWMAGLRLLAQIEDLHPTTTPQG